MADWTVVLFDLAVEAVSGVRVGGPRSANVGTDAPVLRDARGPLLPGSSLKGVLRAAAERLLRGTAIQPPVCDILASPCGGQPSGRDQQVEPVDLERLCLVCRLFGSPWVGSRLYVGDLVIHGDAAAVTVVRDGVAIDRDELKASDRLKYDYEVVVPGTRFTGRLRVDDPEPGDLGLLATLLDLLDAGIVTVGSGTSRGLGRLRLVEPPTASELRASTWTRGAQPTPVDLDASRGELRAILQGVRA
jgi:CRISPR-associated protein Csm3